MVYHCMSLSLLILPPLVLAMYFFTSFPHPPEAPFVHFSLASLPPSSPSWTIYPDTFYDGGAYVNFPHGRVERFSSSRSGALISVSSRCDIGCLARKTAGRHVRAWRPVPLAHPPSRSGGPHPRALHPIYHLERCRPRLSLPWFSCPALRYCPLGFASRPISRLCAVAPRSLRQGLLGCPPDDLRHSTICDTTRPSHATCPVGARASGRRVYGGSHFRLPRFSNINSKFPCQGWGNRSLVCGAIPSACSR
jgi:hypothetical protein